jgi:hypothetical protein
MYVLTWLRRKRPSSPQMKAPVKVTVTARKVLADGTLGESIEVKNVRLEKVS